MPKRITLADIAKKSKVSLTTVSLVLHKKPGIPSETRQRVLKAAETLGYKPRASHKAPAASRSAGKHRNLGLVLKSDDGLPPQANPFYSQVLAGIEEACRKRRMNLLYATLPVDANNVPVEVPPLLSEEHVDGLLLVGAFVDETLGHVLIDNSLPVVLVDAYSAQNEYDAVLSDNFRGAYDAVTYLIQHGHRHIGMVGSFPEAYPSLRERRTGYTQALRDHGIDIIYFADSGQPAHEVAQATIALLQSQPQITALFGCNDHAALAALRAADSIGRRVPDDLSLVGFDDIELSQHIQPPLTTMHVDKVGLGRIAVQLLMNRIEFPNSDRITSVISPRLIERGSVRKVAP